MIKNIFKYIVTYILLLVLGAVISVVIIQSSPNISKDGFGALINQLAFLLTYLTFASDNIKHQTSLKTDYLFGIAVCLFAVASNYLLIIFFRSDEWSGIGLKSYEILNQLISVSENSMSIINITVTLISSLLLAPIAEELVFRKFLIDKSGGFINVWIVIIVSSVIYMLLHGLYLNVLFTGILLAIIYHWTRNVFYSIMAHFSINLMTLLIPLLTASDSQIFSFIFVSSNSNTYFRASSIFTMSLFETLVISGLYMYYRIRTRHLQIPV